MQRHPCYPPKIHKEQISMAKGIAEKYILPTAAIKNNVHVY